MPTISQLPTALSAVAQDEIPVSQAGVTRSVTIADILSTTQSAIAIPSGTLLGRASLGPGGPEAIALGAGISMQAAAMVATGTDHAGFAIRSVLSVGDEAVVNAGGVPMRLPLPLLRGLFNPGANVAIDQGGVISAQTDPTVTSSLGTLGQALTATQTNLAVLSARVPTSGFVSLNAQGQMTAPIGGQVGSGILSNASGVGRSLLVRSMDTINVLDFGAVSGGSDCVAAFTAAFAALPSSGGEIFVPAGDYWLSSTVVFTNKPVTLKGAGRGVSRLHINHGGVGIDISQASLFSRSAVISLSFFAENQAGQTAAAVRVAYPSASSFGYVTIKIHDVECFGYPNSTNGIAPFPQTFLRGFVINHCWNAQISDISWFGPPAATGITSSACLELNGSIDTRISGLLAYYGHTAVLQTGYCEGIYLVNPVIVGCDYVFTQTDETTWPGYSPNRPMLLGLWVNGGEANTGLGIVSGNNITIGSFVGMDLTRDFGSNVASSFFNLMNCSNFRIIGCNFVGGSTNGIRQDVAINFSSTWNSSDNIVGACHFENFATIIKINGSNGTVGLMTFGLQFSNVLLTTAFIDNSVSAVGNLVHFRTPATGLAPAGIGCTKDHVFSSATGNVLFQVANINNAANYIRHQPATSSNPPIIAFDGSDGTVNGVLQTKGGNLYINAAGGSTGSGNLLSLLNMNGATNWVQIQNSTGNNLCLINTNNSGLALSPHGPLWLSPGAGLFVSGIPLSRPTVGSGQIWNNNGILSVA